jgi:LacI family transcriptional regulator
MSIEELRRTLPPTLEEVAAAAGVSRSTVSRVVTGSTKVSPEALARVNSAIERLSYVPNRAARSLATRQTLAIALVVPEETSRFFSDPYFAEIVHGITHAMEPSDYVLNLHLASPFASTSKTNKYLRGGNADGAIVVSHHAGDAFLVGLRDTFPVVFGGRPMNPQQPHAYYVDVDNAAAAQMGTQRLIDIGRRRIATIAGPSDMPAGSDRTTGWRRALGAAGMTADLIVHGDFSVASGARAMRELLDREPGIDGVFVASDLMATGAVSVLRQRNKTIPGDVAIVGFDDNAAAVSGDVQLTTVSQPSMEMGEKIWDMLLARLRGEETEHACILETRLVVRASA